MHQFPRVDICVPVYNGRAFIAETLESIRGQRYQHLTVHMSDDGSTDGSPDVCRRFLSDRRFTLSMQSARLGWIENCNWLLSHATSDLVCLVSHDDLIAPDFVGQLVNALASAADSVLAFTDIQVFGLLEQVEHQPSIAGSPVERVRAFIATHHDGTAFHALIRRSALAQAGGLRPNARDHFAADIGWLGRLARAGGFRRVPEPLYLKRRHPDSASLQWAEWSDPAKADAWTMHCQELLCDALELRMTEAEQQDVLDATLRRLLAVEPRLPFGFIRAWSQDRQASLVSTLLEPYRSAMKWKCPAPGHAWKPGDGSRV
jgi:hypothetical protein